MRPKIPPIRSFNLFGYTMNTTKTALVVGATGLVGNACVEQLLQNPYYSKVVVLSRRALLQQHPKLVTRLIDFEQLQNYSDAIQGDDIYYCLGTTIKKAGSQTAFYRIDYEYALQIAQIAVQNKVAQFLLVSSLGADSKSTIFYSRTKGELENSLKKLSIPSLHIFQPSILLGERNESRSGESVGKVLAQWIRPFLRGSWRKYRGIEGAAVAKAMIRIAQQQKKGIFTYLSDSIQDIADAPA